MNSPAGAAFFSFWGPSGGAALYPQTSGPTQTLLGDRGTPINCNGQHLWSKYENVGKNSLSWHDRLSHRFPLR